MQHLQAELDGLLATLPDAAEIRACVESLVSVYPFNEFEFIISYLLARDVLSLDQYLDLRDSYLARNMYLYIFEISAPRIFGESWSQSHLKEIVPELLKPTRILDPNYSRQYDFLLDEKIRIEVKASRAVDSGIEAPLYVKALSSDSGKPFLMNFQQIKPACCDVIVWVAVWRDVIRYWVLSSQEVESSPHYQTKQHRGNIGEGQLHISQVTIGAFNSFEIKPHKLAKAIRNAYRRQQGAKKLG